MNEPTGMKRLIIETASTTMANRVGASASWEDRVAAGAAQIVGGGLQAALRDAAEFAAQAVKLVRQAPGYDPSVHGATDDEIADYLVVIAKGKAK